MYLNPFTALPFASTAASSISVDKGTSLYDLLQAAMALRGPETGTVPIANAAYPTSAGEAVLWNQSQALELFNALQSGQARPRGAAERDEGRLSRSHPTHQFAAVEAGDDSCSVSGGLSRSFWCICTCKGRS